MTKRLISFALALSVFVAINGFLLSMAAVYCHDMEQQHGSKCFSSHK